MARQIDCHDEDVAEGKRGDKKLLDIGLSDTVHRSITSKSCGPARNLGAPVKVPVFPVLVQDSRLATLASGAQSNSLARHLSVPQDLNLPECIHVEPLRRPRVAAVKRP